MNKLIDGPPVLICACSNCLGLRHFKPTGRKRGNGIEYKCPVCGLIIIYNEGEVSVKCKPYRHHEG